MPGRRLAIRILGVADTVRGFAYALTEGPGCLVDVNTQRQPAKEADIVKMLGAIIAKGRPLFVAFASTATRRGTRASVLDRYVTQACAEANVMILRISQAQLKGLTKLKQPSRWHIAEEIARRYPEIAHRLPQKRGMWRAEDERIGLFHSVAVVLAAWQMFRPPRIDDS